MSTINKSLEIFQQVRRLKDLYTFSPETELVSFLKSNTALIPLLYEMAQELKENFPESKLALNLATPLKKPEKEPELIVSIYPASDVSNVLEKFSKIKEFWWDNKFDQYRDRITIDIEHPDFVTSGNPWAVFEDLTGSIDAPRDWASQHDHYLYGTPKQSQL